MVQGARPRADGQRVGITLAHPTGHVHTKGRAAPAAQGQHTCFAFTQKVAASGTSPESWLLRIQGGPTYAVSPRLCGPPVSLSRSLPLSSRVGSATQLQNEENGGAS